MKRFRISILTAIATTAMMWPVSLYASTPSEEDGPEVGDVQDSGCTDKTRATAGTALVLTKEGNVVTCEINGFVANCGVDYFDIDSDYRNGNEALDTLFVNVCPVIPSEKDCTCPYNVSFTIRNVKDDCFFLNCWLYSGIVSFKESNQVNLDISSEFVILDDGSRYFLFKPSRIAILFSMSTATTKGEFRLPSTVSYKGEDYTLASFYPDALQGPEVTKLILPNTIRMNGTGEEPYNSWNGKFPKLEVIEVEPGSPLLSSVDGVLYSSDHKTLYCLPTGNKRTEYTVIDGVEKIGKATFSSCPNMKSIRLPESVTTIKPYAFATSKNLESIYIPSKLNRDNYLYKAFMYMSSTPTLYVPESEVEYIKTIYSGPVLPISASGETLGISDVNQNTGKQVEHYDLQGRRLTGKPTKGVYIESGRKVVTK